MSNTKWHPKKVALKVFTYETCVKSVIQDIG